MHAEGSLDMILYYVFVLGESLSSIICYFIPSFADDALSSVVVFCFQTRDYFNQSFVRLHHSVQYNFNYITISFIFDFLRRFIVYFLSVLICRHM